MNNVWLNFIKPTQKLPSSETVGISLFPDNSTNTCTPFCCYATSNTITIFNIVIWMVGYRICDITINGVLFATDLYFPNNCSRTLSAKNGIYLDYSH